jgi:hypothetical protein
MELCLNHFLVISSVHMNVLHSEAINISANTAYKPLNSPEYRILLKSATTSFKIFTNFVSK